MKILIIANDDVGLYQFRRDLIAELLQANQVFIALPYGELVQPLLELGCIFTDTPLEQRGTNPLKDGFLFIRYLNLLNRIKPDLVITYTIKPNVYGGIAASLMRIPYAINITGLGMTFQKQGMLRKFVTMMYKLACKKAKVVFFENKGNQHVFINAGIVNESKTCLLNGAGVNLSHFQVLEYIGGNRIRFLFAGRVMQEKGVDELLSAMHKLHSEGFDCSLDIIGSLDEDYSEIIKDFKTEGWLAYHGYQSDVRPFIANCHCFVLPSWHEGMANTNLECAASGRPVITSNIHGCMEAVEDGVTGFLCEPQNVESLYRVMKRFVLLPYEERARMGIAGRKRMEKIFDKNKVVKETIAHLI